MAQGASILHSQTTIEKAREQNLAQQARGQQMAAALHLIPEPRSVWSDRARAAFEQNVFASEYEVDDAMAVDHEAVISEYKEMKTFLQSSNQRQFSPKLYSELPETPVRELEIEGEMVGPADGAFLSVPVLRGVASPSHLHIHELVRRQDLHDLLVDLRVVFEGIEGKADPLIADGSHDHVLPVIGDGGHWDLHHNLGRVGQKGPHCQPGTCRTPCSIDATPPRSEAFQVVGIQELLHLLFGLLQVGLMFLGRFPLPPAGALDHQGHLTPDAIELVP